MKVSDFDYINKLNEIWILLFKYMKEEEDKDLFVFEFVLIIYVGVGEFELMSMSFGWIKVFVLFCSYFSVGEYLLFEIVMGLLMVLMDYILDFFRKFLDKIILLNFLMK